MVQYMNAGSACQYLADPERLRGLELAVLSDDE
jgi:hypothetical protein